MNCWRLRARDAGKLDHCLDRSVHVGHEVIDHRSQDQQEDQDPDVPADPEAGPRFEASMSLAFDPSEEALGPEPVVASPLFGYVVVDLAEYLQREGDHQHPPEGFVPGIAEGLAQGGEGGADLGADHDAQEEQDQHGELHAVPGRGAAADVGLHRLVFTTHESTASKISST